MGFLCVIKATGAKLYDNVRALGPWSAAMVNISQNDGLDSRQGIGAKKHDEK